MSSSSRCPRCQHRSITNNFLKRERSPSLNRCHSRSKHNSRRPVSPSSTKTIALCCDGSNPSKLRRSSTSSDNDIATPQTSKPAALLSTTTSSPEVSTTTTTTTTNSITPTTTATMPIQPTLSRAIVVSMLNNKGASYIENQEYGKAKKSLCKALRIAETSDQHRRRRTKDQDVISRATASRSPSPSNNSTGSNSSDQTQPFSSSNSSLDSYSSESSSPPVCYWQTKQEIHSLSSLFSVDGSSSYAALLEDSCVVEKKSSTKNNANKATFKHRAEYDEGMDYFNAPLRLTDSSRNIDGTILFNLARLQHNQCDFDEALGLYKRALKSVEVCICDYEEDVEKIACCEGSGGLVVDENLTLAILFSIGHVQYIRGDHADALKTYQTCMSLAQAAFGKDSLEMAACLNCIGVLHYIMPDGDSALALDTLQMSLSIRQSKIGDLHIHVGTTFNNIGRIYFQQGSYEEAMDAYQQALAIRRRVQGESVDVAATLFNIGQVYHQQTQREEALDHYKDFLKLAKHHFGDFHRDICIVTTCMGQVYHEQKDFDQALKCFHHALKVGRIALGSVHSEVAITLNKLGNLYYETGDLKSALKAYHQGLKVELAVLEESNPNIVITYTNIAEIHKQQGEYDVALKYYNTVLELQRKYNANTLELANTLSSIGYVRHQHGDFHGALEVNQECLRLRREVKGDCDEDVAATLTHIALVLLKTDCSKMALELLTESYRIRKSLNANADSRDIAFNLYNIALIFQHHGNHEQALRFYLETARVEKAALGGNHRDLSITHFNMGQIFYQINNLDRAIENFQEALKIERGYFGTDHPTVARTLNEIGNIELQRGNIDNMMDCYGEALRIYRSAGMSDDHLVIFGLKLWRFERVQPLAAGAA